MKSPDPPGFGLDQGFFDDLSNVGPGMSFCARVYPFAHGRILLRTGVSFCARAVRRAPAFSVVYGCCGYLIRLRAVRRASVFPSFTDAAGILYGYAPSRCAPPAPLPAANRRGSFSAPGCFAGQSSASNRVRSMFVPMNTILPPAFPLVFPSACLSV